MKGNYQFSDSEFRGIPFIDIWGDEFCYEDLYELLGKNQYMGTFTFKPGSDALNNFGETVTGVIFYSSEEIEAAEKASSEGNDFGGATIRIDSPMPDLSIAKREDLKYGGVQISDIIHLNVLPYKKEIERYASGDKKIPNLIEIPFEHDPKMDYDVLYQNYILGKFSAGVELLLFEKEKFVGITLGINDETIDPKLVEMLGLTLEYISSCNHIWLHVYKAKERRKKLTAEEKIKLKKTEIESLLDKFESLANEIRRSGINPKDLSNYTAALKLITSSLEGFEPNILLHGSKQVYWDVEGYLHVVMRHAKQAQIGGFKDKTTFPYPFKDLKTLIEKVLGKIKEEIIRHFEENSGKDFRRSGRMSIPFNGDFYCLQISKDGRLVTIYAK